MKIRPERTFMPLCLLACVYLIAHAPTLFKNIYIQMCTLHLSNPSEDSWFCFRLIKHVLITCNPMKYSKQNGK